MEEIIEIAGPDGLVRRGMLALPVVGTPRAALMLLTAGVKHRTGPGQLYVAIARRLADRGVAVLRVDPAGLGESDGAIEAAPCHQLWQSVERGRFVPDALLAAADFAHRLAAGTPLFLGGLCGGGLTAQMAAAALDQPPAGIISLNIAAVGSTAPGRRAPALVSESRARLRAYPRKLISLDAWKRVVTGATSARGLPTALAASFRRPLPARLDPSLNPEYISSLRRTRARQIPHLMIFSGNDQRWFHFNDLVLGPLLDGEMTGPSHTVRVIPDADHNLVTPAWRHTAADWMAEWMARPR